MTTPAQQQVQSVLDELRFKTRSESTSASPAEYEVTKDTLEFLQDKVIVVKSDGSVEARQTAAR